MATFDLTVEDKNHPDKRDRKIEGRCAQIQAYVVMIALLQF